MSSESQKTAIAEDNDLFMELEKEIENLLSIQLDLISENMNGTWRISCIFQYCKSKTLKGQESSFQAGTQES